MCLRPAQAKSFLCCDGVNMLGNLWAAQFAAVTVAAFLLVCMFAYIGKLDALPPKACVPFFPPCSCRMQPKVAVPSLNLLLFCPSAVLVASDGVPYKCCRCCGCAMRSGREFRDPLDVQMQAPLQPSKSG